MNSWLSGIRRRLIAFALWMAARTVSIMFSFARQTWLPLRQNVARTLQALKEPGLPTWRDALLRLPLVAVFVALPIVVFILIRTEPIGALAISIGSITFLGALLGAQAAIAALTLAVMLFLMQGVSARRDVDDRVYAEYIRQSWVWPVFCGSIGAAAFTGAVLTVQRVVGDAGAVAQGVPGVSNLAVLAVVALAVSLAAPVALFARAIMLAEPEHWQRLRLDVNKRGVSEAVSAFLGRFQRAVVARVNNEPDFSVLFPDSGERSADQAIRALLDDARRAMDERRHGELVRSLDSIETLVSYAMDEIEGAGVEWAMLGTDNQWPPLRELGPTLYSYREEVIRAGYRDYLQELLELDYWFVSTGLRRSCRGLVTFGLSGYRWNYGMSARLGSRDHHEMLRDRFLMNLDGLTFGYDPESLAAFMRDVIKHQGEVLSDALHSGFVEDYLWLHREFGSILSNILERWNRDVRPFGTEAELSADLRLEYRIATMGLTGRAVILSGSGDVSDPTPYLDVARGVYGRSTDLAADVSAAMRIESHVSFSQWWGWDTQYRLSVHSDSLSLERYPLTCFAVLLMDRVEDSTLSLNLRGNAQRVLDWFVDNAEGLEPFVRDTPASSAQQRRDFAIEILQAAVRTDEVEEDLKIISREISSERVVACRDGVDEGMESAASAQTMFEQAGALVRLVPGVIEVRDLGIHKLFPKAFLVNPAEGDQMGYSPVDGDLWGRRLAEGEVDLLCGELEQATPITAPLDAVSAFFAAVDAAVDDLDPEGNAGVVVAGDWGDDLISLYSDEWEGYEPSWRLSEPDSSVYMGRYRGHPVARGATDGERRVYVVDLGTWGTMVRVPFGEAQDVLFEVEPISAERAQELLDANPDYFPDQPDEESKLRKLQTLVAVRVAVRVGFRCTDPAGARRISHDQPSAVADAECSGLCSLDCGTPDGT